MSLYSDFEFEQLKDSLDLFRDIAMDDGEDELEVHKAALQLAIEALSFEPKATRNLLYKYVNAVTDYRLHICPERYIEEGQKILREHEQRRLYEAPAKGNDADIPAGTADNRRCPVAETRRAYCKPAETSLLDKCRARLGWLNSLAVFEDGEGNCFLVGLESKKFFNYDPATNNFALADEPRMYRIEDVAEIVDELEHKAKADSTPTTDSNQEG